MYFITRHSDQAIVYFITRHSNQAIVYYLYFITRHSNQAHHYFSLSLSPPPPSHNIESYRCQFEMAGAVNNLVQCLNFADSSVQASSVEALGMLCCNASARQQV